MKKISLSRVTVEVYPLEDLQERYENKDSSCIWSTKKLSFSDWAMHIPTSLMGKKYDVLEAQDIDGLYIFRINDGYEDFWVHQGLCRLEINIIF